MLIPYSDLQEKPYLAYFVDEKPPHEQTGVSVLELALNTLKGYLKGKITVNNIDSVRVSFYKSMMDSKTLHKWVYLTHELIWIASIVVCFPHGKEATNYVASYAPVIFEAIPDNLKENFRILLMNITDKGKGYEISTL